MPWLLRQRRVMWEKADNTKLTHSALEAPRSAGRKSLSRHLVCRSQKVKPRVWATSPSEKVTSPTAWSSQLPHQARLWPLGLPTAGADARPHSRALFAGQRGRLSSLVVSKPEGAPVEELVPGSMEPSQGGF